MLSQLPFLLLGPWAGVWADRLDRRRLLIFTQTLAMLGAFTFAALVQTGVLELWHIYVLAVVVGSSAALDMPAQQAFISDLAGIRNLSKAIVLNATTFHVNRMIGPALAGWLLGAFGASPAFWANGVSYLAVIGSLVAVRGSQVRKTASGSATREFREGLRFLLSDPRLLDMFFFSLLVTFFSLSNMQILPAVASQILHGGAETLGLLMGAGGCGALVGSVALVPQVQRARLTGRVLAAACVWSGLSWVFLSVSDSTALSAFALFLGSLAFPPIMATAIVVLQTSSPPDMRARLLSVRIMLVFGMQPFASMLVGYGAHYFGSPMMMRLNGILMVVGAAVLLLVRRDLRRWEAKIHAVSEPVPGK